MGDSGNALHESVRKTNNEYVREAVQRALEGDIEKRVYERIKGDLSRLKFLGGVGAILLLVAGYFHEPIFRFIIDVGGKEFKNGISKDIADEEVSHRKMMADMDAARDLVNRDLASTSSAFFGTRQQVSQLEVQLNQDRDEIKRLLQSLEEEKNTITARAGAAQSAANEAAERLDSTVKSLSALAQNQDTIVAQLKNLKADTSKIQPVRAPNPPLQDTRKPTVYFQFAGFTRAEAEAISQKIQNKGWTIPGEERTSLAAQRNDTNQVRYNPSSEADAENARRLMDDANAALRELNWHTDLQLQRNTKVTPGIVEIWILKL